MLPYSVLFTFVYLKLPGTPQLMPAGLSVPKLHVGFGNTLKGIGIVIGLGIILGRFVLVKGQWDRVT